MLEEDWNGVIRWLVLCSDDVSIQHGSQRLRIAVVIDINDHMVVLLYSDQIGSRCLTLQNVNFNLSSL